MSRPTPSATETLGARLAAAIEVRDRAALRNLFATPVQFRAITPRRFWDAETPSEVADIVLGTWFAEGRQVTDVSLVEDDTVGDVSKITYRMSVATESGPTVIEQVAYYAGQDDRITQLRLVCSGFRPSLTTGSDGAGFALWRMARRRSTVWSLRERGSRCPSSWMYTRR